MFRIPTYGILRNTSLSLITPQDPPKIIEGRSLFFFRHICRKYLRAINAVFFNLITLKKNIMNHVLKSISQYIKTGISI